MSEMNEFFGTPGASEGKVDYVKAKRLDPGEDVVGRIIPPVKSQKATGKWQVYHRIHWGYHVPNGKDPKGKAWPKPFLCIKKDDMRTGMVVQACPKCDQIATQEASWKAAEAAVRTALGPAAEDKKALNEALKNDAAYTLLNDWKKLHNAESAYFINLKYLDGSCGTLFEKPSMKKSLDDLILKEASAKFGGDKAKATQSLMDPAAGWYLQFSRNGGKGVDTKYSVAFYQQEFVGDDGETMYKKQKAPLTAGDIDNIKTGCLDLAEAHGCTILTEKQIQQLVDSDEDPETVKAIMDAAQVARKEASAPKAAPVVAKPAVTPAPKGEAAKTLAAETVKSAKKGTPKAPAAAETDSILQGFVDEAD